MSEYKFPIVMVDLWGDIASFTQSESKVERRTYPVITPSAARGALCAIYMKPLEFYYQIRKIQIIQEGTRFMIRRNEVTRKADMKHHPIKVEENHTQRGTEYLRNVYYRITAEMVPVNGTDPKKIRHEFEQRLNAGKCFYQPFLGTKECLAFFAPANKEKKPVDKSEDLGIMLYDIFDIRKNVPLDTSDKKNAGVFVSYYHPYMINGVIDVPPYESFEIFKPGGATHV